MCALCYNSAPSIVCSQTEIMSSCMIPPRSHYRVNFVVRVVFNHWFSLLVLWQTFKSDVLELQAKKDSLSQELADMNQKLEENKHQLKQDEIA